ncbi:MAG: adenylate/guanylate cyclase domain-containing protein [Ignavibacteria bacterium]|nr:adenylate/guanylate cyclase domain-containing protein [Ignavibacteria bacterium]
MKINNIVIKGGQVNYAEKIENIYFSVQQEIQDKLDDLRKWAGGEKVTLAIVFTDIVDSTPLGEKLGDTEMNMIRQQHIERGEKVLKEHDGFLIKTIGDSLMVAFRNVENVLDFTRAFRDNTGNELVKIRQGAHIGITSIDNDDLFGSHVNRAARIAHLANADEIVVSDEFKKDVDTLRHPKHKDLQWELIPNVSLKGFEGTFNLWKVKNT